MPRKPRSDKGKPRPGYSKGKKRKSPRPHKVRGFDRGGPLNLGELLTVKDKDALKLGYAWGDKKVKKK